MILTKSFNSLLVKSKKIKLKTKTLMNLRLKYVLIFSFIQLKNPKNVVKSANSTVNTSVNDIHLINFIENVKSRNILNSQAVMNKI